MSIPSCSFHSFLFKLPNKGMSFPFPPLKLPNKGREEYSKMILFIPFHSISFSPPKRSLKDRDQLYNLPNFSISSQSNFESESKLKTDDS